MKDPAISSKQLRIAVFAALLSPLMRVLPRAAAQAAGKAGWLCSIPAFAVLLLLSVLMSSLRRQALPREGMAELILRFLGPVFGRLLLLLYGGWFLFYASFILRSGAERLTAAVYQQSGAEPFILLLLLVFLIASLGTMRAIIRTGGLLMGILLAVLALVCLFSVSHISIKNLIPLSLEDVLPVAEGSWSVWTVGGAASLFSFLGGYTDESEISAGRRLPLLLLFCFLSSLICIETVGTFGGALTSRLSYPFFTMIRDISLFGFSQRFEAMVIALWVFADFLLCTLLLRCAHEAFRCIFRLPTPEGTRFFDFRHGRWLLLVEAAAVYAASRFLFSGPFLIWSQTRMPLLMNGFVFGGFSLIWLVGKLNNYNV